MFRREKRATAAEVQEALTHGKRFSSTPLALRVLTTDKSKIAVVVPKHVEKTSIARHATKRKIIHTLKKIHLPQQNILVFIVNKQINHFSGEELASVIKELLDKAT